MPKSAAAVVFTLICLCRTASATWQPVPAMDWTGIKPADFTDRELEIPYMLEHFHTVANAIVEEGPTRGFLNLSVNRNPEDNKPHNARIMENHVALAYFYTVDRPWNKYRGNDAVKVRLEAMLEYWLTLHNENGLLPEYAPDNYNLAATGFGVMFMSQTLELLSSGGPSIDKGLLDRVKAAQRKSILTILSDDKVLGFAKQYSNQYGGVYPAAMSYLQLHPDDTQLLSALQNTVTNRMPQYQSPAGYLYEAGASDAGYSGVYDMVLRLSADYLKNKQFLFVRDAMDEEMTRYTTWLSYNFAIQPDRRSYVVNAGPQTRTTMWRSSPTNRPYAARVPQACAFASTKAEYDKQLADRRANLEKNWGKWAPLKVPNAYAYLPTAFQESMHDLAPFFPNDEQRNAAIATLPYLADDNFNHQAVDPFPIEYTFARRPSYYATFTSGKIRQPAHQNYGLGLVWNDKIGAVIASVGGTNLAWGTRSGGADKPLEKGTEVAAAFTINDQPIASTPGARTLGEGDAVFTYPLGASGRKTVAFLSDKVQVTVEYTGEFVEQIPLVRRESEQFSITEGSVSLARDGVTFIVKFENNAVPSLETPTKPADGLVHQLLTVKATERLTYTITFTK